MPITLHLFCGPEIPPFPGVHKSTAYSELVLYNVSCLSFRGVLV